MTCALLLLWATAPPPTMYAQEAPPQEYVQFDQYNTGIYSLGFIDPLYYQFTGNAIFKDGALPNTWVFGADTGIEGVPYPSLSWHHIQELDYDMPGAYAYGLEFLSFKADSTSTYQGTEDAVGPLIDLNLMFFSGFLRLYLFSFDNAAVHPFFALGWGILTGTFDTVTVLGEEYFTRFNGSSVSHAIGVELNVGESWGGTLELRTLTAYATTTNDPFNQNPSGDTLDLDLSGSMVSFTGYMRF